MLKNRRSLTPAEQSYANDRREFSRRVNIIEEKLYGKLSPSKKKARTAASRRMARAKIIRLTELEYQYLSDRNELKDNTFYITRET